METIYLCIIIFLFVLAVFDLIVGVSNAQFDRTIYRVEHKALPFSSLREALSKEVESCLEEEERLCHLVLKTGGPLPEHEKERAAPRKAAQHAQA